ncbi:MAG TPA: hypothetical protein VMV84_03080, partial [Dehalococcoidales bacterium]|nr:hypothetical protein [Dehalococcoidales bacterium]
EFGYSVIAIDADPDANLAATLGFIPLDQAVVEADLANLSLLDASQQIITEVKNIYQALLSMPKASSATN